MWLLVYIMNEDRFLDELLEAFIEAGIGGATILDGMGMLRFLSEEVPIFAGFRSLIEGTKPTNKIILSVIKDRALLDRALETIDQVVGGIRKGGRGIAFTLEIGDFLGPAGDPRR